MIVIKTLDGPDIDVNENAIVLVAGPYPYDVGPHTYVYGVTPGVLVTAEPAAALVGRLGVNPSLARLTRPNSTPVWIKGAAATYVRLPMDIEVKDPGQVNAVVGIGKLRQPVHEAVADARAVVNAHGGNV